jgi:hypothetical protein
VSRTVRVRVASVALVRRLVVAPGPLKIALLQIGVQRLDADSHA